MFPRPDHDAIGRHPSSVDLRGAWGCGRQEASITAAASKKVLIFLVGGGLLCVGRGSMLTHLVVLTFARLAAISGFRRDDAI